jgi:predicted nuclease of predicted toxin-antitoxin system
VIKAEKPTFFIDRALGRKYVADALRNAGAKVEVHEDHFSPDSPDTEWLPEVSQRGWLILTKDDAIGRNILEQVAIASSDAKVFVLSLGNVTGQEMASIFAQALEQMENFAQSNQPPFIAKVYKFGKVRVWKNHTKLLKILKNTTQSGES